MPIVWFAETLGKSGEVALGAAADGTTAKACVRERRQDAAGLARLDHR